MKRNIFIIAASILLLASSCAKQMNYKEYVIYDRDYVSQQFSTVGGFVTAVYNAMEYDFGNYSSGAMLASATDESEYSIKGNGIEDFYNGSWGPTNPKQSTWDAMYTGISSANTFLTQMQGLKFEDLELNKDYMQQMYRYNHYAPEVRALRAYLYFCLVRAYGAVPIVKEGMTAEEINSLSRSSSDDVFKYIIDECDAVKDLVIEDYSNLGDYALGVAETGRIDKLGVLAVKARAALYWASPLFNPTNDATRWQNAAKYYKELVAACEARGMKLTKNYQDIWDTNNYATASITQEILFSRRVNGANNTVEGYNYPVGLEGAKGGNCPTQNLVDAYCMLNGKAIDAAGSGYDPANPYANRDPRFALTVAYNGCQWPTFSGAPLLETFTGGKNGLPLTGATTTGYYLRKLCHGSIDLSANSKYKSDFHTYVLFRMGGIYLDYAECVFNALGGADATSSDFPVSARELASKTRVRAGLPEFETGLSKNAFWEAYKNERMVELAFEGHRFFDVRRWKEAPKYFTEIRKMQVTKNADGTFKYDVVSSSRKWDDKMYLFPIPQSENQKNPNLGQNPGW